MIRMSRPAITDMIGEMWATVRVIWNALRYSAVGKSRIEAAHFIPLRGSTIGDAYRPYGFRRRRERACIIGKELIMRNRIFAIAAIVGAISAPLAAQAQSGITTGLVRG